MSCITYLYNFEQVRINLGRLQAYRIDAWLPSYTDWKQHHLCDEQGTFTRCVDFYRFDVWPACDVSQRPVLKTSCVNSALSVSRYSLDTESTTTCDPYMYLRLEPRGLLLQSAHRVTAFSHRQASARPQCSCPCYSQHQEVWKRVITDTASRPSLAGC